MSALTTDTAPSTTNNSTTFVKPNPSEFDDRMSDTGKEHSSPTANNTASALVGTGPAGTPYGVTNLRFDNRTLDRLPIDPEVRNYVRDNVKNACFSLVQPEPVVNPKLVAASLPALQLIDLNEAHVQHADFAEYFSGNKYIPGTTSAAHCYCGHQFGYFSGQLGDGAAMYLGEVINRAGQRWEIQFKGAGPTPYSRRADGRKVLRSSLREFLCSEHMHALGIPSTRAGTCVTSDKKVVRDLFYTGNAIEEKATVILRLAPTFLRFGSFEIFKKQDATTGRAGPSHGNIELHQKMLDYVIESFYPDIWSLRNEEDMIPTYAAFYREIVHRTARMVAGWQCVGWVHGVLNTDNMSIVGVTIDYGPYGFLDRYDPHHISNTSDENGRYAYDQQPQICRWNCEQLMYALTPLLPLATAKPILDEYDAVYKTAYRDWMRKKLGLCHSDEGDKDDQLIAELLRTMEDTAADFTNTFRCLNRLNTDASNTKGEQPAVLQYIVSQCDTAKTLLRAYRPKVHPQQLKMLVTLMKEQPEMMLQLGDQRQLIEAEIANAQRREVLSKMNDTELTHTSEMKWNKMLYTHTQRLQRDNEAGVAAGQSLSAILVNRKQVQNSHNPRFVLRNWMAQAAIAQAEDGNFEEAQNLLKVLMDPYDVNDELTDIARSASKGSGYDAKPPEWAPECRVSCSS